MSIWLAVDPMTEKHSNLSPYVYCSNNPVLYIDPDGKFEIPIHKEITETVAKQLKLSDTQLSKVVSGVQNADYLGFAKDYHFDGRKNFSEISTTWDLINKNIASRGDDYYNLGYDIHTVQDFYSHSNYVELYVEYYQDQGGDMANFSPDNVPLFEEGIKDQTFKDKYLVPKLRTGDFDLTNNEKTPWTNKSKLGKNNHYEMNKDSNASKHGREKISQTNISFHQLAKKVATKATSKILSDSQQ